MGGVQETKRDDNRRRSQLLLILAVPLVAIALMAGHTLAENRPGGRSNAEAAKFRAEGNILWVLTTLTAFAGPALGGLLIRDSIAARGVYAIALGMGGVFVKVVAGAVIWLKFGGGFD